MNEIVIYTDKRTYFLYLLAAIIFGIIGVLPFVYKDNLCSYFAEHVIFSNSIFWIAWSIMFGGIIGLFGTVYYLFSLFKPTKFVMKINQDGFLTQAYGFVFWSNISNLKLDRIQGSNYITFDIKEGVLNNKKPIIIFSNPYVISLFYTGVNAKKLYNIMQQYLTKSQCIVSG